MATTRDLSDPPIPPAIYAAARAFGNQLTALYDRPSRLMFARHGREILIRNVVTGESLEPISIPDDLPLEARSFRQTVARYLKSLA